MKKIAMIMAAAAIAVSASAQKTATTASKTWDNFYVGVKAGASTNIASQANAGSFGAWDPSFGIRVGKNFTTVFGLALDANMFMNAHSKSCAYSTMGLTGSHYTFVNGVDVNLLATVNLMNAFAGYKGEPRAFEVYAVGGLGWAHAFPVKYNAMNVKAGFDFAYNFGANKEWQVYVEPTINYGLETTKGEGIYFDINRANFNLQAGVNYKFKCSNGKHNFAFEQLRDQSEIDGLNSKINQLRSDVDAANKQVADANATIAQLRQDLAACQNKPVPTPVEVKAANLQPSVVFAQGKSVVEKSQLANVQMIANYMKKNPDAKVKISGYASPEGNAELNQKLSEARAAAVKEVLVKKYKISADRLETEGLGATDKLFDEVEFNRVALFNDTTK